MKSIKGTLLEHFRILPDPRRLNHNTRRHELLDIIIITVLAVIGGADTWVDVVNYGKEKEEWLKQFLDLPNGIPSHDTFARVFSILNPDAFHACFTKWVKSIRKITKGEVIAIDGKTVRRAHQKDSKPPHIISAFATANGITLGQLQVDDKTNEITAIPELLKMLFLKGCIVTTDAMGCQGWIVRKIVENKGDYVLAVKGNQGRLYQDIQDTFNASDFTDFDYAHTSDKSHGRVELRECWVTANLFGIRDKARWDKLTSVVKVTDTRNVNGKATKATRYFISSLKGQARETLRAVRAHWAVENTLHWSLDIAFREDESRVRIGHAQKNLALVRKLAHNLLRNEKTAKGGVKAKRLAAGWNEEYLLKVLLTQPNESG
jgi:predicted transposase YbfD/YdcC